MALNLAVMLSESTKRHGGRVALLCGETRLTYNELNAAANKVANALRSLGVQPGDKVAIMVPNVPQFPIIYYGILKMGATVVPLSVLFKAGEVHYHLEDSDAVALFVWEEYSEEARKGFSRVETCRHLIVVNAAGSDALPEGALSYNAMLAIGSSSFSTVWPMPDDTAVIMYTSGTTGYPKGAQLTHFNMFYNAAVLADRLLGLGPDTVGLGALPLYYSFGQSCVMNALVYAGGTISLLPHFDAETALATIARDKVTYLAGVPTIFLRLLQHPQAGRQDTSSLSICISGGAAMPPDVLQGFEERFKVRVLEGYGLAETSAVASLKGRDREPRRGSLGLPIWGTEMRLMADDGTFVGTGDVGEIVVRGHNVMKGYYKRPEATAEAFKGGWLHTGDIGRQDEDGYFYMVDRKKDVIIRSGFNVYPREVEAVLYGYPAVAEAAVVGLPDATVGEEVGAFVVLKPNMQATAEEIIAYCRERMAAYKYPRTVQFRDALPKDSGGRVLKRRLRE